MKIKKILLFLLIGGLIGFSINFTFSFRRDSITFEYAAFIYAITGFIQQRRNIRLINYENFLLFWYIIFLISFGCLYYYSWDLPVLLTICIIGFLVGYLSAFFWTKKHLGKFIAIAWVIIVFIFNLIFVPRFLFTETANVPLVNLTPKFQLLDIKKNTTITNIQLKGKTVFLDFWNVHCGPCVRSFPKIDELYEHYRNDTNVCVYLVNCGIDSLADIKGFVTEKNIKTPVLYDSGGELTKKLEINGFPFHIILDREGKVRFNHLGYNKDEAAVFVNNMISEINSIAH